MHHPLAVVAYLAAVMAWAPGASASQLSNLDSKDHNVTVIEGNAAKTHVLQPSAKLEGICIQGCVLRLDGSEADEYELDGSEVVSIEDGYLYYDGPVASAEPKKAEDADQPAAPGSE